MTTRSTNVEFITKLMTVNKSGALMQSFVIEAIAWYAKEIKEADLSSMEGGLISPEAWLGCAEEALEAIDRRFKG